MGSSASKTARAAGSAARKYPTSAPAVSNVSSVPRPSPGITQPGPTVKPQPHASSTRDETVNLDASDPDFARSLRSIGPVQPNPTLSPTSAFPHPFNANRVERASAPDPRSNPAIAVLEARSKLRDEAEQEFMEAGRRGHPGRQFLDVYTIRQILFQRDEQGKSATEIERALGLKQGVVARLGNRGILKLASDSGQTQQRIEMV